MRHDRAYSFLLFIGVWLLTIVYLRSEIERRPAKAATRTADDAPIIVYNRVPKTGSTTFMDIVYRLSRANGFSAIHINITRNRHTLALPDQHRFVVNVTRWHARRPAVYHGHVAYIDFTRFGAANPMYIQIVRKPLDRFITYYYFLRCGDDHRPHLTRSRAGDNTVCGRSVQAHCFVQTFRHSMNVSSVVAKIVTRRRCGYKYRFSAATRLSVGGLRGVNIWISSTH
jgi:hypothetical protein